MAEITSLGQCFDVAPVMELTDKLDIMAEIYSDAQKTLDKNSELYGKETLSLNGSTPILTACETIESSLNKLSYTIKRDSKKAKKQAWTARHKDVAQYFAYCSDKIEFYKGKVQSANAKRQAAASQTPPQPVFLDFYETIAPSKLNEWQKKQDEAKIQMDEARNKAQSYQ